MIDFTYELDLIKKFVSATDKQMYCATSGGKDSAVIMYLVSLVYPDCLYIHNPKDDTDPRTISMLYDYSKQYNIIYCHGSKMPDVIKRFGFLGQVDGTKRCEWDRTDKSSDVIIDGINVNRKEMSAHWVTKGIWDIQNLYPILDWSDEKVFTFCYENNIPLSKEYDV
jgi:3'-phosphoadenosine 5'-phosphosulfate sulfotransferase (PAPS reductase)/FAD synthetase